MPTASTVEVMATISEFRKRLGIGRELHVALAVASTRSPPS